MNGAAQSLWIALKYSDLLILYCSRYKGPVGAITDALETIDMGHSRKRSKLPSMQTPSNYWSSDQQQLNFLEYVAPI